MPPTLKSAFSIPSEFPSWYLACRSADLRPGTVLSREFLGRPVAIFRGKGGTVHALSAHCSHMGAHLGQGEVVGDCLRCPLHHWEYDGAGLCRRIPGGEGIPEGARQLAYPVAERYGGVFLFNGPEPLFPPPSFTAPDGELAMAHGRTVLLKCPLTVLTANAFDMRHLETLHQRTLRETPAVERLDRWRLRLRFVARVTGRAAVDRVIRRISGDRVEVTITCWGGSLVTVENNLGRVRSVLLLSPFPVAEGIEVRPIYGVPRSGVHPLDAAKVAAARWLFDGFLGRDIGVLDGMQFRPRLALPGDAALERFLEYLNDLPVPSGVQVFRRSGVGEPVPEHPNCGGKPHGQDARATPERLST
jgi:aminopyrrolnitrin oxygenase